MHFQVYSSLILNLTSLNPQIYFALIFSSIYYQTGKIQSPNIKIMQSIHGPCHHLPLLLKLIKKLRTQITQNTLHCLIFLSLPLTHSKPLQLLSSILQSTPILHSLSTPTKLPFAFSIQFSVLDKNNRSVRKQLWSFQILPNTAKSGSILELFTSVYKIARQTPLWVCYLENQSVREHFQVRMRVDQRTTRNQWLDSFNEKLGLQVRVQGEVWNIAVSYWAPRDRFRKHMLKKNRTADNLLTGRFAKTNRRSVSKFVLPKILVEEQRQERQVNLKESGNFQDLASIRSSSEFEYLVEDARLQRFKDNLRLMKKRILPQMELQFSDY